MIILSFEEDANLNELSLYKCKGYHEIEVMNYLCLVNYESNFPVFGFHNQILPFLSPDARHDPSGDHCKVKIQFL